jgi:uncharacterized protein (TIGR01319 family)
MPTPMAVLKAAKLLADGTSGEEGLGELVLVDVGGATTDVCSIGKGYPTQDDVIARGLPEPYEKRTVEGDLGIRYNADRILEIAGEEALRETLASIGMDPAGLDLRKMVERRSHHTGSATPASEKDIAMDAGLASAAVGLAMKRHVGFLRTVELPSGRVRLQYGKDLTRVKTVIGTGGVFVHNSFQEMILKASLFDNQDPFSLKPTAANFYCDDWYILYGVGLLVDTAPAEALRIAKKSLKAPPRHYHQ